jgi:hypothetical protein
MPSIVSWGKSPPIQKEFLSTHLAFDVAQKMSLKAGDDAADFAWIKVSKESVGRLYASHGLTLLTALLKMAKSQTDTISEITAALIKKEFGLPTPKTGTK